LGAAWVVGEYGDALLRGGQAEEDEVVVQVAESEVVDLFSTILNSSYATQIVHEYLLTCLMKLTTRLQEPAQLERVRRILQSHSASLDVEIQQRSVEYGNLFAYDEIRRGVLEKMPPPEIKEAQRVFGEAQPKKKAVAGKKKIGKPSESDMLLDLMGGSDMPGPELNTTNGSKNNADLLADILGGGDDMGMASPGSAVSPGPQSGIDSIMDLFGNGAPPPSSQQNRSSAVGPSADLLGGGMTSPAIRQQTPSSGGVATLPCYNKNGLLITIQLQRSAEGVVQALAKFKNTGSFERISSVSLQAAVPKTQKLQLQAISSAELEGGEEASQAMRVLGSKGVSFPTESLILM
jgi:AP-1 complex subunit gamma-1